MASNFSEWFLSPRLSVSVCSASEHEIKSLEPESISILLVHEDDLQQFDGQDLLANQLYGALKPNHLYPFSSEGKKFFFAFSKKNFHSLSFKSAGKAHVVSQMGSVLASQLLALNSFAQKSSQIVISLNSHVQRLVDGEQSEFFLGILQRSISNQNLKSNSSVQKCLKKLFFSEDFFSQEACQEALAMSYAMSCTRTLIHMPGNVLNPASYEAYVRHLVKEECQFGENPALIDMQVLSYEHLQSVGCQLICAVGQGSQNKPRIIKLTYSPKGIESPKKICLVGKGISFDTGGLNLKASGGMRWMKKDMGGSAAALGSFLAAVRLGLPVQVTCWLALAENMVSGNSMRPGDVYRAHNGLFVEIENTDAEGRLVLADAISLACEEPVDWLIDLATLTGAARTALGPLVDCLYGNEEKSTQLLHDIGVETGDWVWPIPLVADYDGYYESSVADWMNGSGSAFAGSITAALFLQKFVKVPRWNHIDTYMWCDKPHHLWAEGSGPTAKCVRLMVRAFKVFSSH